MPPVYNSIIVWPRTTTATAANRRQWAGRARNFARGWLASGREGRRVSTCRASGQLRRAAAVPGSAGDPAPVVVGPVPTPARQPGLVRHRQPNYGTGCLTLETKRLLQVSDDCGGQCVSVHH